MYEGRSDCQNLGNSNAFNPIENPFGSCEMLHNSIQDFFSNFSLAPKP